VRTLLILVLFLGTSFSAPAFALPDELEVHTDDTSAAGQFSLDVIANYTASGPRWPSDEGLRPSAHLLQISPDLSYGITSNTQIGLQLFASISSGGDGRIDGGRIELLSMLLRPDDDDDDGLFLGGLFEAGHLPSTLSSNDLDAEMKMILGYRTGRWLFATNPEVGFKLSGKGSSSPDFAIKFKAAYRMAQGYSLGLEHYGDLGQSHNFGTLNQQSQQTFAVVDFKARGMEFNIGIGRGWNDESERWVLKSVLSFPFGN